MSRNLARMMGRSAASTQEQIADLEHKNGYPSEDVRFMAENKILLRQKLVQLGLDPDDTTDAELYHALRARFERDADMLDKAVGINKFTGLDERLSKAEQLVVHCVATDDVWVPKNSAVKAILAANPPKHVAKQLNYRSAASMIKREEAAEIALVSTVAESATWQKNFSKSIDKLSPSQRELRPIKIVSLSSPRWQALSSPPSAAIFDKNLGAAAVWPSDGLSASPVLSLSLLLLEAIERLNPAGFSAALHELSPALRWWSDTGHLISDGRQPVSLNLRDVSLNHLLSREIHEAERRHGATSLWDKLSLRYQAISAELADKIPDIQYNFDEPGSAGIPTSAELAEEYAAAE
ncbi:MAG TPA: hypothetical protein VFW52_03680 [Candidatus Saccharimonadales bacterium]|nr:hypothetical protein [Candidatus Saccharimonadales bacterium]